jgi:hypothetical protein
MDEYMFKVRPAHPTHIARMNAARSGFRLATKSRRYKSEREFQNTVIHILRGSGLSVEREPVISLSDSEIRADFRVGEYMVECKACAANQSIAAAIGQCVIYRTYGYKAAILIPSDLPIRQEHKKAIQSIGIEMVLEHDLTAWLTNYAKCG